jgi:glycosyltransferase involved in cell wall biosynthesis
LVIVIHNEENAIAKVVLQTRRFVDRVVVCDDGSTYLTGEIAEGLGAVVVRHERNREYSAYDINNSVPTIGLGKGNV